MLSSLLATVVGASDEVSFDYLPFRGLQIAVRGVPVVQGSAFQYYEKGWTRGIYSSNWRPVEILRLPDGTLRVRFQGDNGQVTGTHDFRRTPTGISAHYEFRWRGSSSVKLESSFGLIWAPAFAAGQATINGLQIGDLTRPSRPGAAVEDRKLGPEGGSLRFDSPLAEIRADVKFGSAIVFDARNYSADWAKDKELFWFGFMERDVRPQETVRYQVDWTIRPKPVSAPTQKEARVESRAMPDALRPDETPLPLLPKPKSVKFASGDLVINGPLTADVNGPLRPFVQEFESQLWRRWRQPILGDTGPRVSVRTDAPNLPVEGYRLKVDETGITISARDEAGARHGLQSVVMLARAKRGALTIPFVEMTDYPTLAWRGVHMFVGPDALRFQQKLADSVLAPMKFNHVVLQCERTAWEATAGTQTPQTMAKTDLAALVDRYRGLGIEPIPLVQSLGHAGWLFANGKNLDIALNRDVPFTVDPRKARTRELYTELWTEVVDLFKPKTIHFGLDEIDMRGLPADPHFTTRIWKQHVPFLLDLAKRFGVRPMMWGDIMLGPGEAPDATHAKTKQEALERRQAIGKGVMIADWHYKDDPDPEAFTSLKLWKADGQLPVASTWFRPNNIRGMALAAAKVDAGLLQTTWAGYESNERNMVKEFHQFAAYILAGDYAWSGRAEMPSELGYDPGEVLRRLHFAPPSVVSPVAGHAMVPSNATSITAVAVGQVSFRLFSPITLHSLVHPEASAAPDRVTIQVSAPASEVALAVDCLARVADTDPVLEVEVRHKSGKVTKATFEYGTHLRAITDDRPTLLSPRQNMMSAIRIPIRLDSEADGVREIVVSRLNPAAGPRVHGITVF